MITREELIHEMSLAILNNFKGQIDTDKTLTTDAMAEAALDVVMGKVADPLISILEDASPFGKIAADQIKKIANKA